MSCTWCFLLEIKVSNELIWFTKLCWVELKIIFFGNKWAFLKSMAILLNLFPEFFIRSKLLNETNCLYASEEWKISDMIEHIRQRVEYCLLICDISPLLISHSFFLRVVFFYLWKWIHCLAPTPLFTVRSLCITICSKCMIVKFDFFVIAIGFFPFCYAITLFRVHSDFHGDFSSKHTLTQINKQKSS